MLSLAAMHGDRCDTDAANIIVVGHKRLIRVGVEKGLPCGCYGEVRLVLYWITLLQPQISDAVNKSNK